MESEMSGSTERSGPRTKNRGPRTLKFMKVYGPMPGMLSAKQREGIIVSWAVVGGVMLRSPRLA